MNSDISLVSAEVGRSRKKLGADGSGPSVPAFFSRSRLPDGLTTRKGMFYIVVPTLPLDLLRCCVCVGRGGVEEL